MRRIFCGGEGEAFETMFEHTERLPHPLKPSDYSSDEQFEREVATLLKSAWYPVALTGDFAGEGCFRTFDVLGKPIVVWRGEGELRAFLNVCAHRFSKVASAACGTAERLRCPYHGWEYSHCGRTAKIPEAHGFKPLAKGDLGLTPVALQTLGNVVFVSLDAAAAELLPLSVPASFLKALSGDVVPIGTIERRVDVNWKLIVENAIESYHVEEVHKKTFKANPPAEQCRHELGEGWSSFSTASPPASGWQRFFDAISYRMLGIEQDPTYRHLLLFPNVMLGTAGMFSWCHVVEPIGPTSSQVRMWMFMERTNRNIVAFVARAFAKWNAVRFTRLAMEEDLATLSVVQQGLAGAPASQLGCLSPREERVWHFQSLVKERTAVSRDQAPSIPMTDERVA